MQVVGSAVSAAGALALAAGRDIVIDAGQETHEESHERESSSSWGKLLTAVGSVTGTIGLAGSIGLRMVLPADKSSQSSSLGASTTSVGSVLSGATITSLSGRDTRVSGSTLVADSDLTLVAGRDLSLLSAQNTLTNQSQTSSKATGNVGSWWQRAFGTVKQSSQEQSSTTTQVGTQVASLGGDITLSAGGVYTQVASDVLAVQGDVDIGARQIDIISAVNSQSASASQQTSKTAVGGSVSVPLINAVQGIAGVARAATQTSDGRMQALAAATLAMQAKAAAASAQSLASGGLGGIKVSVSLGSSRSESDSAQNSQSVVGSTVAAGGNIRISASGAGADSDLTIEGSRVEAGGNVGLSADDQIRVLAAANTASQQSSNSSSGASVGVGFAFGGAQNGFTLELAASKARGQADGSDVVWTNSEVAAGNVLTLSSGGDTTLKGAVASGRQVVAQIGGDLRLESLQDISRYDSDQRSSGLSLSVCVPPFCYGATTGSVSAGGSTIRSDYASVGEQTGFKAGDGGFQIAVKGDTELTGAVIASTDKAVLDGKNRFSTGGTLTMTDLHNTTEYDAQGYAITLSGSTKVGDQTSEAAQKTMSAADKAAAGNRVSGLPISQSAGAGIGQDSGSAGSTSASGISGIAGDTAVRTGDAETGIKKIFDADKVQKEINAQVQITQAFGQQASTAWGEYANRQFIESLKGGDQDGVRCWGPDGSCRAAGHALIGGASGGIGGAVGAGFSSVAAPHFQSFLVEQGLSPSAAQAVTQLAAIGSGAAVGGSPGAAGAFNEASNNALILALPLVVEIIAGGVTAIRACVMSMACRKAVMLAGVGLLDKMVSLLPQSDQAQLPGFGGGTQPQPSGTLVTPIPDPREMQKLYGTPPLENPDQLKAWLAGALEGYPADAAEKWAKDLITTLPAAQQQSLSDFIIMSVRENAVSGKGANKTVVDRMSNPEFVNKWVKNVDCADCSDIARQLYKTAGESGKIIEFTSSSGKVKGIELGKVEEFNYHEIYTDGKYVYDPRYSSEPVSYSGYIKKMRELNPGLIVKDVTP